MRKPRTLIQSALTAAVAIALFAPGALASESATPARAAAPQISKNFKVTYNKSWTFKSRVLRICVIFSVHGNFTYHVTSTPERFGLLFTWSNQRANNPTLEADIHAYSGGSCIGPAAATGISMGQH